MGPICKRTPLRARDMAQENALPARRPHRVRASGYREITRVLYLEVTVENPGRSS